VERFMLVLVCPYDRSGLLMLLRCQFKVAHVERKMALFVLMFVGVGKKEGCQKQEEG
jgi:uncharacterized protein YbaR (Trm112 family)